MAVDAARAKSLFLAASDLGDPAARAAFLARECGGDAELRNRVEALLQAHDAAPLSAAGPDAATGAYVPAGLPETLEYGDPTARVGAILAGKYKLIEAIGEGGMGSVFLAQQTEPVKRAVAVKVIKAGMDSRAVLARFEAERQALALMDHPNIARVLDAGTTDSGRPFFVMELVKGQPITKFCDARKLTPRERLELFVPVCQAIQHAHQKGIIHRDIKPSNVLIALYDDRPVPKVIDFGLAKAAAQTLTDQTLLTGFGAVVGTPEYMSPEQANLNNLDIDTRSDVYSLGVLLYELLTGSTPVDRKALGQAALLEILRMVREVEAPRPSAKLSTIETLPSVAANRGTEPAKLSKLMKGELDWVVLKALEKDRARRYETANGLARDIQRYLADEMVEARPPSAGYRLKKFVTRNRGAVLAAGVIFAALLGGLVMLYAGVTAARYGLLRARDAEKAARADQEEAVKQRQLADRERQLAVAFRDKALDALRATTGTDVELLLGGKTALGANEKAYLEAIAKRWQAFAQQEGTDAQTRAIRAEGHFRVATLWDRLGRQAQARPEYEQALALWEKLVADFPTVPDYRIGLAASHSNLGLLLLEGLGLRAEAQEEYQKACVIYEKLARDFPAAPDCRGDLARCHNNLGLLLVGLGKSAEAQKQHNKALVIYAKLAADFPAVPNYRIGLATSHHNLGTLLAGLKKPAEAQEQYHKALVLHEKLAADFPTVPEHRRALAASHNNLGTLLADLGQWAEAQKQHNKALVIYAKLAADFPVVPDYRIGLAGSHHNLGVVLTGLGHRAEAQEQYQKALLLREKLVLDFPAVPMYRRDLARSHHNLGVVLADLRKWAESQEQYQKALLLREKLAADFPTVSDYRIDLGGSYCNLGMLIRDGGRANESVAWFDKAIAMLAPVLRTAPHDLHAKLFLHNSHYGRAIACNILKDPAGVVKDWTQILELGMHGDEAWARFNLGSALLRLGKMAEAEIALDQAGEIRTRMAKAAGARAQEPNWLNVVYLFDRGLAYGTACRYDLQVEWFTRAIREAISFSTRWPGPKVTELLCGAYQNRALALDRLLKHHDAVKDWDRAIELSSPAAQAGMRASRAISRLQAGLVAEAVAEVDELTKSPIWNASQWYDFACVYAVASGKIAGKKQEHADRAMELLRKAVGAGYKDAAHMKRDTDLDSLRERPDFKKLLAELEAKAGTPSGEKK